MYSPVCGNNGRTYTSRCEATCKGESVSNQETIVQNLKNFNSIIFLLTGKVQWNMPLQRVYLPRDVQPCLWN